MESNIEAVIAILIILLIGSVISLILALGNTTDEKEK
jgi:hypothetical protein